MGNKFQAKNHFNPVIPQAVSCPKVTTVCVNTPCQAGVYLPNKLFLFVQGREELENIIASTLLTWHADTSDWRTFARFPLACGYDMAAIVYCDFDGFAWMWRMAYDSTWPGDFPGQDKSVLTVEDPWRLVTPFDIFGSFIDRNCEPMFCSGAWTMYVSVPPSLMHIPCSTIITQGA